MTTTTTPETRRESSTQSPALRRNSPNGNSTSQSITQSKLVKSLGWFSVGLGVTQLIAPRLVSKLVGARTDPFRMRALGARELTAGIGILTTRQPAPWLWARVAGDAMDLAALGMASTSPRAKHNRLAGAVAAVAGVAVLDAIAARAVSTGTHGVANRHTASVMIGRPREECYRLWRDLENLPSFMKHLKSVRLTGENRSHWIAKPVGETELSWDAEITHDIPDEQIAWRSIEGSEVTTSGRVLFQRARGGSATVVRVLMSYKLPARFGGFLLGALPGHDPAQVLRRELLGFKQLVEAGEIATTEGQSAGNRSGATWLDRMVRV